MEAFEYNKIVDKYKPKENKLGNLLIAFFSGGIVGLIGNILLDFYSMFFNQKDSVSLMIITLIFLASLFTALGFFDNWVRKCRCGLIIPITGFAHSMTSSVIDYKREGLITGFGSNLFKLAGSVILYGVVASFYVGLIRYLIGG